MIMQLTRVERWILSSQYRILEALYPKEAEDIAYARKALEEGYELEYDGLPVEASISIYPDGECLSSEGCREVLDILDMFRVLKRSYEALEDKSGVEVGEVAFSGFSANEEGPQWGYTRYFCDKSGGRYPELERGDDFNSHLPLLAEYRRMLREWHNSEDKHELSKEDIARIVAAMIDPARRDQ